ncbi:MAG: hypothetical protein QXT82_12055 [Candidatus Caldarchaeum sp.]
MRRKVLLGLFPYLIQAVAKMGNMTRIHFDSSFFSAADNMVNDVLETLKGRLQITKTDEEIRVTLDLELLMEIVEEYLRKEYAGEGGASSMLKKVDEKIGILSVVAEMKIPHRYVYVSLSDVDVKTGVLEQLVEELAPNHIYILTTGNEVKDSYSKPMFVAENKVLWGRVRCLPISKLLQSTVWLEGATDFQLSSNHVTFSLKTLS